eukprot:5287358-Alexandrium_andersonii.AAC.1
MPSRSRRHTSYYRTTVATRHDIGAEKEQRLELGFAGSPPNRCGRDRAITSRAIASMRVRRRDRSPIRRA